MRRTLLKSKIHRATITEADLHYVGSLTLDPELMEAADLLPHERIEVYNVNNGERLATYAIPGERGKGQAVLNGAAARKASPGDLVIICSYAELDDAEARQHEPRVVFVDENNRIREQSRAVVWHREPLPVLSAVR